MTDDLRPDDALDGRDGSRDGDDGRPVPRTDTATLAIVEDLLQLLQFIERVALNHSSHSPEVLRPGYTAMLRAFDQQFVELDPDGSVRARAGASAPKNSSIRRVGGDPTRTGLPRPSHRSGEVNAAVVRKLDELERSFGALVESAERDRDGYTPAMVPGLTLGWHAIDARRQVRRSLDPNAPSVE